MSAPVSVPPPSASAVLVCQGRAVADGRYAVGRFSDPVAVRLLDPPERAVVDLVRSGAVPPQTQRMASEMVRRCAVMIVPRTVAIDVALRAHPAPQVVILGAGLDGRAWRMPELAAVTVFDVDRAASLADRTRRVGDLVPLAGRLVEVAADLASEPLDTALSAAGFDRDVATTWVWEGVVPYLTAAAVRSTVAQVAALSAPGSRLVVNYQARSVTVRVLRRAMRAILRMSRQPDPLAAEPWRSTWRPSAIRDLVRDHGFDVLADDSLLALGEGMGLPPGSEGSLRNGRVLVAARR